MKGECLVKPRAVARVETSGVKCLEQVLKALLRSASRLPDARSSYSVNQARSEACPRYIPRGVGQKMTRMKVFSLPWPIAVAKI